MSEKFGYSYFVVKQGQYRPSVMLFQLACTQLADLLSKPEWVLTPDGNAGPKTDKVIDAVQKHYGYNKPDGWVGKGTWGSMSEDLGAWRPPLRLRLAELQNTFENGNVADCFGACNVVGFEGWANFGIWNVNAPSGSPGGSSLGILLSMAGRTDLYSAVKANANSLLKEFFASKKGREVQLTAYMNEYILKPAIGWLAASGFEGFAFDAAQLPTTMDPMQERLLALSVDIAVNSGPYGYASKRVPRRWDGRGTFCWDNDLPDRDGCRAIFAEVFGVTLPTDPAEDFNHSVSTRDPYLQALKRCLWEVCTTDEQRINLIADLQGRCIQPRNNLAEMVIQRRRAVARKDGYRFQGSDYCLWKHFGIGI